MNTSKLWLTIMCLFVLTATGCARHHHGPPGHGPTAQEVLPEVNQLVDQNIKDPQKASEVKSMIQDIANEVRRSGQQVRGYHEQLAVLNSNYDAKPEQFTKVLDELNNARMQSAAKILEMRFRVKDKLSPDEWKNLNDAMMKARKEYEGHPSRGMQDGSPKSGY